MSLPPMLDQDQDFRPSLPGFAPVLPSATAPDPLDPEATETTTTTAPTRRRGGRGDSGDGGPPTGTSPLSIPEFFKQRSKAYGKIAAALLGAVGGWVNRVAGDVGEAWLPDDDDMEVIPPPLGRIAARRIKIGAVENLSDVEDIGQAAVGLVAWAAKGISATLEIRRERRKIEEGRAVHDGGPE